MGENYELLSRTLNNLFAQALEIISSIGLDEDQLSISIPSGREMEEMDKVALASLVAKTSNTHSKAARLAGIARAEYKLAYEAYKRKYKANKVGKNETEREASAVMATEDESERVTVAESVVAIAEGVESAARVASESARKIMDKLDQVAKSESRERSGYERSQQREAYPEF